MNAFIAQWDKCLQVLSAEISDRSVIKKFRNLKLSFDEKELILTIESTRATLNLVNHYKTEIEKALRNQTKKPITIQTQTVIKEVVEADTQPIQKRSKTKSSWLSSHLRFSNFITGPSYDEPFLALKNYINIGYEKYSPLLIFGDNGLGKTHLLHAAGNALDSQGYDVVYLTVIKLLELQNEQITKKNRSILIQEKIDAYDVLIVDDIQNFEGKKGVSAIFFDLVDSFIRQQKRILLVADKKPGDLKFFNDRIKSRLLSGLVVKIKELDIDTAINIVKSKKEIYCPSLNLKPHMIQYIAENFSYDVRAIEGALKRIDFFFISYSDKEKEITLADIKVALRDIISNKGSSVAMQAIIQLVCDNFNIPQELLMSTSRKTIIVLARHISMYLIRENCNTPYARIGKIFGNKDPSTVISACKKMEAVVNNKKEGFEKICLLMKASKDLVKI